MVLSSIAWWFQVFRTNLSDFLQFLVFPVELDHQRLFGVLHSQFGECLVLHTELGRQILFVVLHSQFRGGAPVWVWPLEIACGTAFTISGALLCALECFFERYHLLALSVESLNERLFRRLALRGFLFSPLRALRILLLYLRSWRREKPNAASLQKN